MRAAVSGLESEPLPDPLEAFNDALKADIPWLFRPDRGAILQVLDDWGLTICWKAPTDHG